MAALDEGGRGGSKSACAPMELPWGGVGGIKKKKQKKQTEACTWRENRQTANSVKNSDKRIGPQIVSVMHGDDGASLFCSATETCNTCGCERHLS